MLYDSVSQRKNIILNMINHLGPISRTALIDLTGFRPATVGAIAGDLLAEDLIVETENISVGHGRKRVLLDINKKHVCAIGISFAPRHVTFILSQFDGQIVANEQIEFSANAPTEAHIQSILDTTKKLLNAHCDKNIVGIGLCKFLFEYSFDANTVDKWIREVLMTHLAGICELPIRLFSEITLPAIAEQRYGVAKGKQNFIWVNMTNDIRTSLFCNGVAIGGASGAAGALGHTVVNYDSKNGMCYCGKPGCVEQAAAYPALLHNIKTAIYNGVNTKLTGYGVETDKITFCEIRRALDEGDRMCRHYVREAAHEIGLAISNAVNLLNPEMIVTHGFMLRLGKQFKDELERTIRENVLPENENIEICISNEFENPMLLGAVAELFADYIHVEDYRWVYQLSNESHE